MKKLVAHAIAVAVVGACLFVFPAAESTSTQVFSRAVLADGDGGQ